MKLFILAAGKGTRLMPLTKNTPKSLLTFDDGYSILERQLEVAIKANVVNEVVIITGYKSEQIEAKIKDYQAKIPIRICYNPVYDITNNLVSVWVAHHLMLDEDFMITNGDNVYKDNVLGSIQTDSEDIIQVTIDYKDKYDDDDMKVKFVNKNQIGLISKAIALEDSDAESVGLVLVKGKRSRSLFVNKVIELVKKKEYLEKFWLEIFNSLINSGVSISYAKINQDDWQEVDFHPDVDIMKKFILE